VLTTLHKVKEKRRNF